MLWPPLVAFLLFESVLLAAAMKAFEKGDVDGYFALFIAVLAFLFFSIGFIIEAKRGFPEAGVYW
jgi:hypothetical protein